MSEVLASLLIAVIGLLAGLLGAYVAGRQQYHLEEQKWRAARQDELDKERRLAIAELSRKIVAAVQTIARLAWYAQYQSDHISSEDISDYDKKIDGLLSEIMGSLVIVSALDSNMHAQMNRLVRKVYNLDDQFAKATILLASSRDEGIQAMADCLPEVVSFWGELNQAVADMFSNSAALQPAKSPQK
jgi:hypothetical protein